MSNPVRGRSKNPAYHCWENMRRRCSDPTNDRFDDYGARGIKVCPEWEHDFQKFLSDMGERPQGTTLDRRDNNLGYTKDNCRWATAEEQQRNRRNNRRIELNGEVCTLVEWSRRIGAHESVIWGRLKRGWPLEKALLTPISEIHQRCGKMKSRALQRITEELKPKP